MPLGQLSTPSMHVSAAWRHANHLRVGLQCCQLQALLCWSEALVIVALACCMCECDLHFTFQSPTRVCVPVTLSVTHSCCKSQVCQY